VSNSTKDEYQLNDTYVLKLMDEVGGVAYLKSLVALGVEPKLAANWCVNVSLADTSVIETRATVCVCV
jgi:hypothetical protein